MSEDTVSEYRVKVIVRNNLILNLIEETGYTSIPKFAKDHGIHYNDLNMFISLKKAPITSEGEFCVAAKKLMEIFGAAPNDLWTDEQLTMKLHKNYSERGMDRDDLDQLAQNLPTITGQITYDSPEEALYKKETVKVTSDMLEGLTPRERKAIILRWGVDGAGERTLEQVANILDVTRERVRQIEAKAFRKLRRRKELDEKPKAPERIDFSRVALALQNTGAAQKDRRMVQKTRT
jgi:RNA polymerase sigma factor (sigma-70 family)